MYRINNRQRAMQPLFLLMFQKFIEETDRNHTLCIKSKCLHCYHLYKLITCKITCRMHKNSMQCKKSLQQNKGNTNNVNCPTNPIIDTSTYSCKVMQYRYYYHVVICTCNIDKLMINLHFDEFFLKFMILHFLLAKALIILIQY